jgi:hypothetical protein
LIPLQHYNSVFIKDPKGPLEGVGEEVTAVFGSRNPSRIILEKEMAHQASRRPKRAFPAINQWHLSLLANIRHVSFSLTCESELF